MFEQFDPEKWLNLGVAGASLFTLLVISMFVNMLWSRTVDKVARRHNDTLKEITKRQDETQRDTNTILRDLCVLINSQNSNNNASKS